MFQRDISRIILLQIESSTIIRFYISFFYELVFLKFEFLMKKWMRKMLILPFSLWDISKEYKSICYNVRPSMKDSFGIFINFYDRLIGFQNCPGL